MTTTSYLEALRGISAYPIPLRTIAEVAQRRNFQLTAEVTPESLLLDEFYQLAKADLLIWLSLAPAVSQGGQSYSFTEEQRAEMRSCAQSIYKQLEPHAAPQRVTFGYKGTRL